MNVRIVIDYNAETGELRVDTPESIPLTVGLLTMTLDWVKGKAPDPTMTITAEP